MKKNQSALPGYVLDEVIMAWKMLLSIHEAVFPLTEFVGACSS